MEPDRRKNDRITEVLDAIAENRKAINDHRQESTAALGALKTEVAGFKGNIEARVEATEDYIKTDEKWSRIHKLLLPAYAIGHAIAAHFGVKL